MANKRLIEAVVNDRTLCAEGLGLADSRLVDGKPIDVLTVDARAIGHPRKAITELLGNCLSTRR